MVTGVSDQNESHLQFVNALELAGIEDEDDESMSNKIKVTSDQPPESRNDMNFDSTQVKHLLLNTIETGGEKLSVYSSSRMHIMTPPPIVQRPIQFAAAMLSQVPKATLEKKDIRSILKVRKMKISKPNFHEVDYNPNELDNYMDQESVLFEDIRKYLPAVKAIACHNNKFAVGKQIGDFQLRYLLKLQREQKRQKSTKHNVQMGFFMKKYY